MIAGNMLLVCSLATIVVTVVSSIDWSVFELSFVLFLSDCRIL